MQEPNIQRNHSIVLLVQFNPYIFNFPPKYFRLVNRRTSLYLQFIVPLLSSQGEDCTWESGMSRGWRSEYRSWSRSVQGMFSNLQGRNYHSLRSVISKKRFIWFYILTESLKLSKELQQDEWTRLVISKTYWPFWHTQKISDLSCTELQAPYNI